MEKEKNGMLARAKTTTLWLIVFTLMGRGMGLLRECILSYVYGATAYSDAYGVATTFSSIIFAGLAAAILNGYIVSATGKKDRILSYTKKMLVSVAVFSALLAGILIVFLKPLLNIMTQNFSENAYEYTYTLSKLILVASPILCLINVVSGFLQVRGFFLSFSLQSIITNGVMIFAFFWAMIDPIKLGVGYIFSLIIPFFLVVYLSVKEQRYISDSKKSQWEDVTSTWMLVFPTVAVQVAAQINALIDRSFASQFDEGTISCLRIAFLICNLAVSIIAVNIAMVRFPVLSEYLSEGNNIKAWDLYLDMFKKVLWWMVPVTVCLVACSKLLVSVLFEHGAFSYTDTLNTIDLLFYYSFAIVGWSLHELAGRFLLARKRGRQLIVLYVVYVISNVLLNYYFINYMGACGLALGTSIATILSAMVMNIYIAGTNSFSPILGTIKNILSASVIMLISICLLRVGLSHIDDLVLGVVQIVLGGTLYFLYMYVVKDTVLIEYKEALVE